MKTIKSNILVFVLLVVFQVGSFAQNSIARQEAIRLIQEGDANLRLGGWNPALISYTNAIETDPEYAAAYIKRGQLYERIFRAKEAAMDYDKAIKLNPLIDIYYDQRARLKMLSFDYYGALDDITQAININNSNRDYLKYQIDGFISLGRYEEALKNLDSANLETTDNEFSYQRKALIHILNDDIQLAEKMINKAFAINSSDYLTLDILGVISLRKQDYNGAISWFNEAIVADPNQYMSYYNRSICYRLLGEIELALNDIDESIKINNEQQEAFFKRALIKKEQGNLKGSIVDYGSAIEIDSIYVDAIYNRSIAYKILGDYKNASEDIDFLIEIGEEKPEYWNMKGNLLVLHGDMEEALKAYASAISLNYDYSEAHYNKGIANLLLNRPIRACDDFQKSISLGNQKAEEIVLHFCGY